MRLKALLHPETVAVIGASDTPGKVGYVITKNLLESGVEVYPVNPNELEVLGIKCNPSVLDVPEHVDLAVIAVGARHVLTAIDECLQKKVDFVIPVAGGFSEIGEAGKELQEEMATRVKGTGTRILGPNTVGVMIPGGIDTFFIPKERSPRPRPGSISIVSQSGSLMLGVYEKAEVEGVGIRACVGIGNKADLNENDFLRHFRSDPKTKCITFYLESFEDGVGFFELARETAKEKAVVVAKVGVTASGAKAALSHTGALASGSDSLVSGMLRQCGAIRTRDERELLDASKALASVPPMHGDRVAVVGSAGGFGVVATDYVSSDVIGYGMRMAEFSEETKKGIRAMSPYFASVENPIDLTGAVTDSMYDEALEVVNRDEGVDGIVLFLQFEPPGMTYGLADVIIDWAKKGSKPMVVCCVGGSFPVPFMKRLDEQDIPTYGTIKRAVFALRCLYDRGRFLKRVGVL
ncbi:MAG TPA: CoA-binding protein [Methanomassiliicoccales archaeon]|nr:CoA-binding protein [Methanomassiliicoccales archaeon]